MKVVRTAALIVGAVATVALVATGIGIIAAPTILGLSMTTIAAGAALVSTAATMAAGKPRPSATGSPEQFKADPQAPIPYVMGRSISGGYIVHRAAFGPELNDIENPYQGFVVIWSGGGPIQEIEAFTVDNVTINFDGAGVVTSSDYIRDSKPYMWLRKQLGACPEGSALASPISGFPGWGASSKLSGYAAGLWVLRFDKQAKIYASGVPRPGAIVKGVKVYDPRLDSTYPGGSGGCRPLQENSYVYSENPWLHEITFALGRWQNSKRVLGVGMAPLAIDMAAMVEAANVADANGWKIGGTVSSSDDKWNVLKMIAQAGGGEPIRLGAKLSCLVNAPRVSLATVTRDDLVGRASVVATQPRRDRINGIIPRIRSEEHGWEVVPLDVVRPTTYLIEDGEERTRETDLQLVQDKDQAAELAAYEVVNSREFGPISLPLKTKYMGYKPGDCLTIDIPELGLNDQTCIIIGRSLDPVSGIVTLEFKSETNAKHDFALGRTGVAPPTPGLTPPDLSDVPAPTEAEWAATGGVIESDAGKLPAIFIIGAATFATLDAIIFEYRKVGETEWAMAGTETPTTTQKIITGLPPEATYEVAVSYQVRGMVGARLVLGPVVTGEWGIIGSIAAVLNPPTATVQASYFGEVLDYSPAQGSWDIRAGGVDVTEFFTIDTAPDGNLGTLDVTYVGSAYAVTGGFDPEDNSAELMMRATGSDGFSAVTFDRTFRLAKVRAPYPVDNTPPLQPSGLELSSSLQRDTDGTQRVYLHASWDASGADDINHYRLYVREEGGNFVQYLTSEPSFSVPVLAGITYEAKVEAVDHSGNVSNTYPTPPDLISHTAAADSSVPSAPTSLTAHPGVTLIHLTWTNDGADDLHHVDLYENSVDNSGTATLVASVLAEAGKKGYTTRGGLNTGDTRYYWLKSVDTSGNASGFSSVASATTDAVGNDDIFAGSLYANRLMVSGVAGQDALPTGITIGVSGTTIGTVDVRAADPIGRANTQATKLAPGLVLISGSTTLASWRHGSDNTKIDGGEIFANSITLNKASIGLRGVQVTGVQFSHNTPSTNQITWTSGNIEYVNDSGTATSVAISSSSASWSSGTLYIYWVQGANTLSTTTTRGTAYGANNVVLGTYRGGTDSNINYGRTIIDGDWLKTDTVDANVLKVGTITSRELATSMLISTSAQLGNAVVDTLQIDGAAVVVTSFSTGGDTVIAGASGTDGAVTDVFSTGFVTVGDGVYGAALITIDGYVDTGTNTEAAQEIYLYTDTGSGWTLRQTRQVGVRTVGGDTYARIPISATFMVSGVASIAVMIRAKALKMPGSSNSFSSYFRLPGISIGGGKR